MDVISRANIKATIRPVLEGSKDSYVSPILQPKKYCYLSKYKGVNAACIRWRLGCIYIANFPINNRGAIKGKHKGDNTVCIRWR
jgi:hypothetical protein